MEVDQALLRVIDGITLFGLEGSKAHSIFRSPTPNVKAQAFKKFKPLLRSKQAFHKSC